MATALLIIDVQDAILRGAAAPGRQKVIDAAYDGTVTRLRRLQHMARDAGVPVVLVEHEDEGSIREELEPRPGEPVVHKTSCDSFFATDLAERLGEHGVSRLVIGGCMTQYCIDTTCRRAVSLGYDVTLIGDGHMTADMGDLTFTQIIAHHNAVLNGFMAGAHAVRVSAADDVRF